MSPLQARLAEEEAAVTAAAKQGDATPGGSARAAGNGGGGDEVEGAGVDSLDAFMAGVVEAQIEADRVGALQREIAELDALLARTQRLLASADPDGCACLCLAGVWDTFGRILCHIAPRNLYGEAAP